jgi:hypothetical protein
MATIFACASGLKRTVWPGFAAAYLRTLGAVSDHVMEPPSIK